MSRSPEQESGRFVKTFSLLALFAASVGAGCSSWKVPSTTRVFLSGTPGAVVTGYYVRDGQTIAISNTVPWSIQVQGLSSLELRTSDPNANVSMDVRYDYLTTHTRTTKALNSLNGTRVTVHDGLSISTVP